jgi:hypothetical protein
MAERTSRRHTKTRQPRLAANFYRSVLAEADAAEWREAAAPDGLADEVALLRVLVRRHLAERPENLDLTLKGLTLLARLVATQERLSGADAAALQAQVSAVAEQLTAAVLGEEADGG